MKARHRTIVERADIAVSNLITDGGYLQPEQANAFIDLVLTQPTILKQCRTVRMGAPQMQINKIGFYDRILKNAPESGTALAANDRAKPTTSKILLTTKEVIAEVQIPYDVLEDNIEKASLEEHIMRLISERVAVDLEERIICGNTAHPTIPELTLFDGIIKQISSAPENNRFSAGNVYAESTAISPTVCKNMIKMIPPKYFRVPRDYRLWMSFKNEMDLRDSFAASRAYSGGGDRYVLDDAAITMYGVPVEANAWIPNNNVILTHPKNLIFGVQRQIMVETDKDIRLRSLVIVLTMRIDFKIEEPEACCVATGITGNTDDVL